jgi:hypothetical protein
MFEWYKRLIHKYDDYTEMGQWGTYSEETKESTVGGKMYSRTIKIEKDDGTIGLDTEWIMDKTVDDEKSGKWIDKDYE